MSYWKTSTHLYTEANTNGRDKNTMWNVSWRLITTTVTQN